MQGMKAKELHTCCSNGKHMPTRKLPVQENRLPMDMATGRGASSSSSASKEALRKPLLRLNTQY